MVDLDLKDRKILYQLDLNCRQSNAKIGKKVGLSRQVVEYRIKRMEDEGVITGYTTHINSFNLGYQVFRIYIKFHDTSEEKKQEIIKYFTDYKNTWVINSVKVPIDLAIVLWVENINKFYSFWSKTLQSYEKYFEKYESSIYVKSIDYKKSYLIKDEKDSNDRKLYDTTFQGKSLKIDNVDYHILNELAQNARVSLIDLAKKLECSSQKVGYRIKELHNNNIIQGFRIHINYKKIGLNHFKIDIYLKQFKSRDSIIHYLEKQPYFTVLNVSIGWADIEPEFVVDNVENLLEILEDINKKFPNVIRRQVFWIIGKNHKFRWLPEMEFK
jgi:DNA-binding Lrp family transcriptional regulator